MAEKEVTTNAAQCVIIKFLTREKIPPADIYARLKAQFQDDCLSQAKVFILSKSFNDKKREDEKKSGTEEEK